MFVVPRKHVLSPVLVLSLMSTSAQRLIVGSFHFPVYRLLLIFVWSRLLFQRYSAEGMSSRIKLNSVDKAIIFYTIVTVICYTLLWSDSAAFFDQVGKAYTILGFYFAFRFFIRNREDVERIIKVLVFTALLIATVMVIEQLTDENVLAIFGGLPEHPAMREGYIRSQGPFEVYLTAGAFGATLLPLVLCLWHKKGSKVIASLGIVAALTITVTSRTSTAISAVLAAVLALGMWVLRDKMRWVRRGIVLTLVTLHLSMKAPVWALLGRVDIVGGSTGWQRFKIVDNFIRHFWEWCLLGSNNYWNWEGGDDMWDAANQYVATGETSGLLSLVFFIASIVYCFKYLGSARKAAGSDRQQAWFLWLLGVTLFSHLVAFLGISYFDQTLIYWYALLAMIVAVAAPGQYAARVPVAKKARHSEAAAWDVKSQELEAGLGSPLLD
jgi:hypothetical protein